MKSAIPPRITTATSAIMTASAPLSPPPPLVELGTVPLPGGGVVVL